MIDDGACFIYCRGTAPLCVGTALIQDVELLEAMATARLQTRMLTDHACHAGFVRHALPVKPKEHLTCLRGYFQICFARDATRTSYKSELLQIRASYKSGFARNATRIVHISKTDLLLILCPLRRPHPGAQS